MAEKPGKTKPSFDFVVSEPPKYVPGSIPAMPISVLPPHDQDGTILKYIPPTQHTQPRYIVGYKDIPTKVSVRPHKILDWVSARTYEDFEYERMLEEERVREEVRQSELLIEKAEQEAKRKRQERKLAKSRGIDVEKLGEKRKLVDTSDLSSKKPRGRPPRSDKKVNVEVVIPSPNPASLSIRDDEETPTKLPKPTQTQPLLSQPSLFQLSLSQPSLSTPPRRGLAERVVRDFDSEDEDVEDAVSAQIYGNMAEAASSCSRGLLSESSPDPLAMSRTGSKATSTGEDTDGQPPKYANSLSLVGNNKNIGIGGYSQASLSKSHTSSNSNALSSSPSKQTQNKQTPNMDTPSKQSLKSDTTPRAHQPSLAQIPQPANNDIDLEGGEEEEPEWAVKAILAEEERREGRKKKKWYLIDWEDDYEPSWEPMEHVSQDSVEQWKQSREYKDYRSTKKKVRRMMGLDGTTDEEVETGPETGGVLKRAYDDGGIGAGYSAFFKGVRSMGVGMAGQKGKEREVVRGQVIDDDDAEDDEEEEEVSGGAVLGRFGFMRT